LQHRSLVPLDLAKVLPDGVATIEADLAQYARRNAIQCAFIAPQAIVESRNHRDRFGRSQDRATPMTRRRQRAQHEQERLALDADEVIGERRAVVRRAHGNRRPRQLGNALCRVAAGDPGPRRQQHAHVESAGRVADEVQFAGAEAAAGDHLPAQRLGAPRDRGRRLRLAPHDASVDTAPAKRARQCLLHVLEVTQRADGGEPEESRDQEHESRAHA